MGQYGNQPDFGTKAVAITPKGFSGGAYVNVNYINRDGENSNVKLTSSNLAVTVFNDGTPIVQALNNAEWMDYSSNDIPCWAYYNYDPAYAIFGKIYNEHVINAGNIAPNGYNVPDIELFEDFTTNFGYNQELGYKLKSIPESSANADPMGIEWGTGNGGINQFGFNGIPGGYIEGGNGDSVNLHKICTFWSNKVDQFAYLNDQQVVGINAYGSRYGYYIRLTTNENLVDAQPLGSAALYVGTGGDLVVSIVGSEEPVMFKNVADGSFLPIIVTNVWEQGNMGLTTASDIIALY